MKKGFTLVELLAVIVILAIILLVVMPIVLNVVNQARKSAFESSVYGYLKTAENAYAKDVLADQVGNKLYGFENGIQLGENTLEFSGTSPRNGYVYVFEDGRVVIVLEDGLWLAIKNPDEKEITIEEYDSQDLDSIFNALIGTTYTVTYDANEGECTPTSREVIYGNTAAAPSCTRENYLITNFERTEGSGGELNEVTGEVTNVTGNQTIKVNFVINTYTVTYDGNGGSCTPTSITVNHGSEVAAPLCSRSGYNLTGYTISVNPANCSSGWNETTGYCGSVIGNFTVRADWEAAWGCGQDITDTRDSKVYTTVQIGTQCWFAQDLMFNCGSTTWNGSGCRLNGNAAGTVAHATSPSMHYQWAAAMNGNGEGGQGLCPTGWHIPTDAEWKTLEMHLGMTQAQADATGWRGTDQGQKLKSTSPSWGGTNTVGFNAKPSGRRVTSGTLYDVGSYGFLWTSTPASANAWFRYLHSTTSTVNRSTNSQASGFSVRCLLGP